jgi:small subunit ribosomal protein S21
MARERDKRWEARPAGSRPRRPDKGLVIEVEEGNIEGAIKALKRAVQRAGILGEVKRRSYYEKPSERRRREAREGKKRRAKAERKKREPRD